MVILFQHRLVLETKKGEIMIVAAAFLFYVLSFVILFIIRFYLTDNKLYSGDTFFHLSISRIIRENKFRLPSSIKNVIFFESNKNYRYLTYPPLLHYIISIFPLRFHLAIAKNLNLVVLSFIGSLAAIITYNLTSDFILALLSCLIVVVNLSAFDLITQLSPRPLGILFYTIILCLAIFYPLSWVSFVLISLFVGIAALTHKFTMQALILGLIPYLIIFNKSLLVFSLLLGFIIAIIISKGFYLKILKEHFFWLRFYNFKRKILFGKDFIHILIRNPWYIVIFTIFILNNAVFFNSTISIQIFYWGIINLLIAIVVLIPSLSFIGEYYRYIEYSLVPIGISIGLSLNGFNSLIIVALFLALFISFVSLLRLKKNIYNTKMLVNAGDIPLYQSLKKNLPTNLLVIPIIRTLEINYFAHLNVVHLVRGHGILNILGQIIETYKIGYILKFKGADSHGLFEGIKNSNTIEKIQDFRNFELYAIR
jgi:hypothetical protein